MHKKAGLFLMLGGVVLILSALLLFLYNGYEQRRAGREAKMALEEIRRAVTVELEASEETKKSPEGIEEAETISAEVTSMEILPINGQEYIGVLTIPGLDLELPIMADWDEERLKAAPCRHFGAAETDDLVIAGHNYKTHFGPLHRLEEGEEIVFTQINGVKNKYTLSRLEILAPDAVEEVLNSGYDLVLYTCTLGGATRVVAFCDRVTENICGEVTE